MVSAGDDQSIDLFHFQIESQEIDNLSTTFLHAHSYEICFINIVVSDDMKMEYELKSFLKYHL